MSLEQNPSVACCSVTTAGAFTFSRGFTTPARTGAGVYSVVASPRQYALAETSVLATVLGGAGNANIQVTSADGITFAVTTFVGAVATDENWQLRLEPLQS